MEFIRLALLTSLLGAAQVAMAQSRAPVEVQLEPPVERPVSGIYQGEPGVDPGALTSAFLSGHPDLRWRREGQYAYNQKQYDIALIQFRRAARYGDKPAQAMLAEMHWKGIGVERDPALGYAWMDLAAERLYPTFLILRERYWGELDEAQRADAIRRGRPLMDEYGDVAAKPRQAKVMRKASTSVTGSRTGFTGSVRIIPNTGPLAGSGMSLTADEYYADKYWTPEQYWTTQDAAFGAPDRNRVDVGSLEVVRDDARTEPQAED